MKNKNKISREDCIYAICHFAIRYRTDKEYTPREIYEETGYERYYCEITQEQIISMIQSHTDLIESWCLFSQDKRWTPAWAFEEQTGNRWEVCCIIDSGERIYRMIFNSSVSACAQMIRMEMEEFRSKIKPK